MSENNVSIEPATEADLDELSDLLGELFTEESDFRPNKEKQLHGLRLQAEVLGPLATLRSATTVNAELIRRPDLGRIAVGAVGDLVVLDGEPFRDPAVLWEEPQRRIVVKAGVPI